MPMENYQVILFAVTVIFIIHDQQNICIISQVFLKEHDLKEHNDD